MRYILFSLLFFVSNVFFGQQLGSLSRVSLLTVSPGAELYSTFGHSVLRIKDDSLGIDKNYNYGSFDFNASNFYLKFIRGETLYKIASYPFDLEIEHYLKNEGRGVSEQVLNLSLAQRQKLYELLEANLRPENKNYLYKFFYDNCSTRLMVMLQKATDNQIRLDPKLNANSTYRQWIGLFSRRNKKPWADFGMSLALGTPADELTGVEGALFIPVNLKDAVAAARLGERMLAGESRELTPTLYQPKSVFWTPNVVFWLVFVLGFVCTLVEYFREKPVKIFDLILFLALGLGGWILLFLWFGTIHGTTRYNFNLIWIFPFWLPVFFLKKSKFKTEFIKIYLVLLVLFVLFSKVLIPQIFPLAVLPLILLILMRLGLYLHFQKL